MVWQKWFPTETRVLLIMMGDWMILNRNYKSPLSMQTAEQFMKKKKVPATSGSWQLQPSGVQMRKNFSPTNHCPSLIQTSPLSQQASMRWHVKPLTLWKALKTANTSHLIYLSLSSKVKDKNLPKALTMLSIK